MKEHGEGAYNEGIGYLTSPLDASGPTCTCNIDGMHFKTARRRACEGQHLALNLSCCGQGLHQEVLGNGRNASEFLDELGEFCGKKLGELAFAHK